MKIVQPGVLIQEFDAVKILKNIEKAGRTAYKSEDRISLDSYVKFIKQIINSGHHSVLEHEKLTVRFIVDRGVSHEIVRHRIAAYTQESTRYCNYGQAKGGVTFIEPFFFDKNSEEYALWYKSMECSGMIYEMLLQQGRTPQEARSVLPNSLKTEIVVTYNLREWRHFFKLRCAKDAHPQMRQVTIPLLLYFNRYLHPVFDDIEYDQDFKPINYGWISVEKED